MLEIHDVVAVAHLMVRTKGVPMTAELSLLNVDEKPIVGVEIIWATIRKTGIMENNASTEGRASFRRVCPA